MQKGKNTGLFFRFGSKTVTPFKIITPVLLVSLLFAAFITPLHALTPARDLTGTWKSALPEKYYEMDSFDPTMRMNDVNVTYAMDITQNGNSINIVLNVYESSWITDTAYWTEYGMSGVPPVGFNQIVLTGTVSGASFTTDEQGSQLTAEHLAGTFTTDIITATLTGNSETTDTNGIIVLRSGSSATQPPFSPTPTPTPAPAPPTSDNLGSVSIVQGSAWFADTGAAVTTQSQIGTGAEIQTGSDNNTIIGFNYPDQGGTVYLGANSNTGWVYLEPETDPINGNISYTVVPSPTTGSVPFENGLESDEFGQVAVTLPIEIGVGMLILGETLPIALTGAAVVEGTLLLGTGIAYIHEQLSPQEGTYDVRPVQVPQGLVMGEETDYIVEVSNGSTTIQVIDGSVIFVDQYTNNSITISANQMLALPPGVPTGFSEQDLQVSLSAFDASSINQWWIPTTLIATPTIATATPLIPSTPTNALSGIMSFLTSTIFLAVIILLIIIAIAAVLVATRRKAHLRQPDESNQKSSNQNIAQPITFESPKTTTPTTETIAPPSQEPDVKQPKLAFCPNCGNQLLNTKGFCPFCGSDLSKWSPNAKK
jgi:hypothetical protein